MVILDESVFYFVGFFCIFFLLLGFFFSSLIVENDKIMEVCYNVSLGCKMYFFEYEDMESWKFYFGN